MASFKLGILASLLTGFLSANLAAQEAGTCCRDGQCVQCVAHAAMQMPNHKTGKFAGEKANRGYALHTLCDGKQTLTLSEDFVIPDSPAAHWQVVDADGNIYLLNRLQIKGDKYNQRIELPRCIRSVAKVQIWCAWAETLLGEAEFEKPVS